MGLAKYKEKRNFRDTPEPDTAVEKTGSKLAFVIQRHEASHLHYDFRLEMEGVLKSWAIPKGPSMKAGEKRLAMMVEDHPLAYGKFYGEIPKGNYGAGTVEIWDYGTYEPMENPDKKDAEKLLVAQLKKGDIKFTMHGRYLKGSFALVKMKTDEKGNSWLLIKKKDKYDVDTYDIESLKPLKSKKKSSVSNKELASEKKIKTSSSENKKSPAKQPNVKPEKLDTVWNKIKQPMLAKLSVELMDNADWIYEAKYDGYRAIAKIDKQKVEMVSRNGHSFNQKYAPLVKELETISDEVVLDGEIVIEDTKGVSNFQMLQNFDTTRKGELKFYVFDILFLNGHRLTELPLAKRKELLDAFFGNYIFNNIFKSETIRGKGEKLYKKLATKGYEGIIAKEADSLYFPGKRSESWLKVKTSMMQEAVICGLTPPKNSRKYFGSLILGLYEDGKLTYIGNCGTGFTEASLKELHEELDKNITTDSPFSEKINNARLRGKPTWVRPKLVCNVKFQGWTQEGHMRIPVFMGLREDKKAEEVMKEKAVEKKETAGSRQQAIDKTEIRAASGRDLTDRTAKKTKPAIQPKTDIRHEKNENDENEKTISFGRKKVKVTNLNKIYWPKENITKGELIGYYQRIAPYILPYLKDRPLSLNRHPNGIEGQSFYQKDMDVEQIPSWTKTAQIYSKSNDANIDYLICNDEATLIYMVNLGCIEINPWHSRYQKEDQPDYLMMDLDPGDIGFKHVVDTALAIKDICDELEIPCFCKTSGATGLHIFIPLAAKYTYDEVKTFAELLATLTNQRLPKTTSIERSIAKRKDKIYVDFLQNRKGQTIASAYSARPKEGATVSAPLLWDEVNHQLKPTMFTIFNIEERIKKVGDLWAGILGKGISLRNVLEKIDKL
jgi:bifunctional non-homologous end joining protein LigD